MCIYQHLAVNKNGDSAWRIVIERRTIFFSSIKAGFSKIKTSSETAEVDSIKHSAKEAKINPEQWHRYKDFNPNISFQDFLDADNVLHTYDTTTDKESVAKMIAEISDQANEELDQQHGNVTVKEA